MRPHSSIFQPTSPSFPQAAGAVAPKQPHKYIDPNIAIISNQVSIAEIAAAADLTSEVIVAAGVIAETATATDLFGLLEGFHEAASGSDSTAVVSSITIGTVAESASSAVTISEVIGTNASVAESATAADVPSETLIKIAPTAEVATASDTVLGIFGPATGVAEIVSAVDSTDSTVISSSTIIVENGLAVDATSATYSIQISEGLSAVDNVDGLFTPASEHVDETVSAADAVALGATGSSLTVAEVATAATALSETVTTTAVLHEQPSGIDQLSTTASIGVSNIEAASAVDILSTLTVNVHVSIAEQASAIDDQFSAATEIAELSESAESVDGQIGVEIVHVEETVVSDDIEAVIGVSCVEAANAQDFTADPAVIGARIPLWFLQVPGEDYVSEPTNPVPLDLLLFRLDSNIEIPGLVESELDDKGNLGLSWEGPIPSRQTRIAFIRPPPPPLSVNTISLFD